MTGEGRAFSLKGGGGAVCVSPESVSTGAGRAHEAIIHVREPTHSGPEGIGGEGGVKFSSQNTGVRFWKEQLRYSSKDISKYQVSPFAMQAQKST